MSNRGQRPRIYDSENLCLEGSTPEDRKGLFGFCLMAQVTTGLTRPIRGKRSKAGEVMPSGFFQDSFIPVAMIHFN